MKVKKMVEGEAFKYILGPQLHLVEEVWSKKSRRNLPCANVHTGGERKIGPGITKEKHILMWHGLIIKN